MSTNPSENSNAPPLVAADSFITLHYRLSALADDGAAVSLVDTFSGGQPSTLSLGTGALSPAIEAKLLGAPEGSRLVCELPASAAFGERNADLVQWVARKLLAKLGDPLEAYHVGDVVQFPTPPGKLDASGHAGSYAGVVRDHTAEAVQFDFNHPMAGRAVRFEADIIGVL